MSKVKEKKIKVLNTFKLPKGFKRPALITFSDIKNKGKVIGELIIKNGVLHFEGKADKSAKLLFNAFKGLVDDYISKNSGKEIDATRQDKR